VRHCIVTMQDGTKHHGIFLDLADISLVLAQFDVCWGLTESDPPELVPTATPSHIAPIKLPRDLVDTGEYVMEPIEPRTTAVVEGGIAIVCQPFHPRHRAGDGQLADGPPNPP
jgi:hypothetical protein